MNGVCRRAAVGMQSTVPHYRASEVTWPALFCRKLHATDSNVPFQSNNATVLAALCRQDELCARETLQLDHQLPDINIFVCLTEDISFLSLCLFRK